MAAAAEKKIWKLGSKTPTQTEIDVANAFLELEADKDVMAGLSELKFSSAKEVEMSNGKKALVIFVPFRLHKRFQKIQARLVPELEKKFSGTPVVIIAQRTILSKTYLRRNPGQILPRSRTLTAVHDAILDDVVYPTAIDGKRIHFSADGTKYFKIFLDPKDQKEIEHKLPALSFVYRKLTNRQVTFLFKAEE